MPDSITGLTWTPFTDVMGALEEAEFCAKQDKAPKWVVRVGEYYVVTDYMPKFIERVKF